jgi:phosphoribosylanthranilate isomerase
MACRKEAAGCPIYVRELSGSLVYRSPAIVTEIFMRTRVKICGITRIEDAQAVIRAGADAIGLVFYANSPRNVEIDQAAQISRSIPPFITRVALFKDADAAFVEAVLRSVEIDLLQFHGSELSSYCERFGLPYIKAIGMKGAECDAAYLAARAEEFSSAKAMLLDGHAPGEDGGSGEVFDWSGLGKIDKPVILAGGLTPENVARAIEIANPFAVDVSSGVEGSPGKKDREKIIRFMIQVGMADERRG